MEQRVQAIAKKIGLAHPEKIQVVVTKGIQSPPAASGISNISPVVLLTPEYLLQPEDLPPELQLTRLDNKEMTEDEWINGFKTWLQTSFVAGQLNVHKTQFEWDAEREYLRTWLQLFRNQAERDASMEFVLGHELVHIQQDHVLKQYFVSMGWELLSFLSLGALFLLEQKVMNSVSWHFEKEADILSAQQTGKAKAGIHFFSLSEQVSAKMKAKYPEMGELLDEIDPGHPPLSERIKYLTPFVPKQS